MSKEELIARARHRVEQKSQERHFSDEIVLNMKRGYESKIKDLETQIEKMKTCSNCKHYAKEYELCCYSLGDEDYDCRGRKWEMKEK